MPEGMGAHAEQEKLQSQVFQASQWTCLVDMVISPEGDNCSLDCGLKVLFWGWGDKNL